MKRCPPTASRELRTEKIETDLAVIGGGLAGICCAITAARAGVNVVLVQDRPVLGGNASSEVRLWIMGATSNMGNNNRWSREGGVLDEILVENTWRNPGGNPVLVDTILLEKVDNEPRIRLLLNTAVHALSKSESRPTHIESVAGFCSQNSTRYEIAAPLFCDASGDGILGYLAGAAYRMGAEQREEFGELYTPDRDYGELLGHSIYFYSRDRGEPIDFTPPDFALDDITQIPRYRKLRTADSGCNLWWLEYGGAFDTVHDTEAIKWELWRIVYGIWNHIKNSGQFPEAESLDLEWVGMIPGKRESRRFEGDYMLVQQDIVKQRRHADAVSYGGWSIDFHPSEGVYSSKPGCTQWHSKGVYQIPYRCLYSRDVENLFLAGRIISTSHTAFASTRVMATCANSAQAVGMAAALCMRTGCNPRDITAAQTMRSLQCELVRAGQFIPHVLPPDDSDLAKQAEVSATSCCTFGGFEPNAEWIPLKDSKALLLPARKGRLPAFTFYARAEEAQELNVRLAISEREGNYTPDIVLTEKTVFVPAGQEQEIVCDFDFHLDQSRYIFVCLSGTEKLALQLSDQRLSGVLSLSQGFNNNVSRSSRQIPSPGIGIDEFDFWLPERRPGGKNIAFKASETLHVYSAASAIGGYTRPFIGPNAWVADPDDIKPELCLHWGQAQKIGRVILFFDNDYDHAMESVLYKHHDRAMPFCIKHYRLLDDKGRILHEETRNHQSRNEIVFEQAQTVQALHLKVLATHGAPAALFRMACYANL